MCENWSKNCCDIVENFVNNAASIKFIKTISVTHKNFSHGFGKIEIRTNKNNVIHIDNILIEMNQAKKSETFLTGIIIIISIK